jgi:hypothetical protein
MEQKRCIHGGLWWWNLRERDHLEDLGRDGLITLRWIVKKSVERDVELTDLPLDKD